MIITNIETVPEMKIAKLCGFVSGNTVRGKNILQDFGADLKNMVGGEIKSYTNLLKEAREEAMRRMIDDAQRLGANAIVNVRLETSSMDIGTIEVYVYGTAVKVVKEEV